MIVLQVLDYEISKEFFSIHGLVDGKCCAHTHATQGESGSDVRGLEPVNQLFNVYAQFITSLKSK